MLRNIVAIDLGNLSTTMKENVELTTDLGAGIRVVNIAILFKPVIFKDSAFHEFMLREFLENT